MRYQKPVVMDLSAGARASGQWPLGCYNGTTPGGSSYCQFGTGGDSIDYVCNVGPLPDTDGFEACITGLDPMLTFCMFGSGGAPPEDTCTSGPLPTQ
jgi:hypothetical protein